MKSVIGCVVGAICVLLIVMWASGCDSADREDPHASVAPRARYDIYVANRSGKKLTNVSVYYGDTPIAGFGGVPSGGYASYGIVTVPLPKEAVVKWVDHSGGAHSPTVAIEGADLQSSIDTQVYFIIDEDSSITVQVMRPDDREAHAALHETMPHYEE